MLKVDLSNKSCTMSSVIQENHSIFDSCESVKDLVDSLKKVFTDNSINTTASRRLIENVSRKKDYGSALLTIYNSYLCGSKLAVDQK